MGLLVVGTVVSRMTAYRVVGLEIFPWGNGWDCRSRMTAVALIVLYSFETGLGRGWVGLSILHDCRDQLDWPDLIAIYNIHIAKK